MQPRFQHLRNASSGRAAAAPTQIEIAAFRSALDQLVQDRGSDEYAVVDVLLDFFASRGLVASEICELGATLFDALNASTAQTTTVGCFEERFRFRRLNRKLSVFVDDQRLATVAVDDASRLAKLLRTRGDRAALRARLADERNSEWAAESIYR
jgi:hypothetical protein